MLNRSIFFFLIALLFFSGLNAQRKSKSKETLLKDLHNAVELWRKRPLMVKMQIQTTNAIADITRSETAINMELFFVNNNYYIRTETMEQLLEDSFLLVVHKNAQQMVLRKVDSEFRALFLSQLNRQFKLHDSLLNTRNSKYDLSEDSANSGEKCLKISSISTSGYSDAPKEEVKLFVDRLTGLPIRLEQINNSLLPVTETELPNLLNSSDYKNYLIKGKEGSAIPYFLLKKSKTVFVYNKISFDAVEFPVTLKDRIVLDAEGNWKPLKSFDQFTLVYNEAN